MDVAQLDHAVINCSVQWRRAVAVSQHALINQSINQSRIPM